MKVGMEVSDNDELKRRADRCPTIEDCQSTLLSGAAHLLEQGAGVAVAGRLRLERRPAAGGVGRRGPQQRLEPRRGACVEGAVGAAGEAGDLPERAARRGI